MQKRRVDVFDLGNGRVVSDSQIGLAIRIESAAIRPRVVLTPLDRLEESPALRTPRQQIIEWLPHATLPEPLQEVHRWTGFAEAFTHASEGADRT